MHKLRRRDLLLWPVAAGMAGALGDAWGQANPDPHAWLEAVDSTESLAWVNGQNADALALIGKDPDFARRRRETLAALSSSSNIPFVSRQGEHLYNFFRSARRPHGMWRRTTLDEYAKDQPSWQTLLNVDDLAREEGRNLVYEGANVDVASQRALVYFSSGGEDKVELREFDLKQRGFVRGGFAAPTAKQSISWFGPDELLIARATPDSQTTSGYAMVLRRWKRGTELLEAPVVLRCAPTDLQVWGWARRGVGLAPAALLHRRIRFFENERFLLLAEGPPRPLALPLDCNAWLEGEWLMVGLRNAWTTAGRSYPEGSLLAIPLAQAAQEQREIHLLFEGAERRRLVRTERVKDGFVVAASDNLRPQLVFQRRTDTGFRAVPLPAPEFGVLNIASNQPDQDNRFWMTTQAPISPQVFALVDADVPATPVLAKSAPHAFDASGLAVRQFEARSADGTLVPYTVVAPRNQGAPLPAVLYGYGGFGLTVDLEYQRMAGINWLQYGGALVLAHIRGGGEFGQSWANAAKGALRQRGFDDFIAVAQDAVARGVTTPKQLGIYGASNGGALVTAVLVQRPELFGAVVSRVPLTDMLGFTRLFAGASWVEEYGDPARPADRAVLMKWSPYQNAARAEGGKAYPPTLFIGNRNDDRVHPAHARKMVAQLRTLGHAQTWLYEEIAGGHSGRSDPNIYSLREALIYSFLRLQLAKA
jgi:prolyl oligopeptidase